MSDEVRDALEAAFEQHEKTDETSGTAGTAAPVPAPAPAAPAPAGKPAGELKDASDAAAPAPAPAPAPTAPPKPAAEAKSGKEQVPADGTAPQRAVKAPASWKPEVREKWGTTDPAVQQEVLRREREVSDVLRQSAESRKFSNDFNQMVQPFLPFIAAENSNPIQAAHNMFQTAALLRVGAPLQKAQTVAQIITQFGIDVQMLDQVLAQTFQNQGGMPNGGQPPAQAQDPRFTQLQQQFAPVIDFVNGLRQKQNEVLQQTDQTLSQTLEEFAQDPANEFFNDVKDDVADILEMAANRKQSLSLQDAYSRAIMLHPTISKIVEQRKLATSLQSQNAAAQRARSAAVSVPSSGAPSQGSDRQAGDSVRSAIEAAFEVHSGQR